MAMATQKPPPAHVCDDLIRQLETLRAEVERAARLGRELILGVPPQRSRSAANLLHYLALRSRDLRPLQDDLAKLGLTSLGRAEPHVMATLNAVLHNLRVIRGAQPSAADSESVYGALESASDLLESNTERLLGVLPKNRRVHIMVTMPSEAADDYMLVHQLLGKGTSCARINCAHDDPYTWLRIIHHIREAERATGQRCRVLMDLAGPKLRTGPMKPAPAVLRVRPVRDTYGRVTRPARIWLNSSTQPRREACPGDARLALDPAWLALVETGDRIRFRDARGSRRTWRVVDAGPEGCWAEARKTAYIINGTNLFLRGSGKDWKATTLVAGLPERDGFLNLRQGDVLFVSGKPEPGRPAVQGDDDKLLSPGLVCIPIPEIYRDTRLGERVCFDDGRITGIIEKREAQQLQIRVTHLRKPVEKLRSDQGVNLPDTRLDLPALSGKDLQDMEFAARHADMVGLSFTNNARDVRALRGRLQEVDGAGLGVVLKIETGRGFAELPSILMEALEFPACGIMIARGDLAVECGFERMAEVQEEILWICEAAHTPVIWATQVLEGLAKRGHATRAEITDAAMGQAAECVMLNKGPHIIEAVRMLDDILRRMQGHRSKKRSMMRKLQLASGFEDR